MDDGLALAADASATAEGATELDKLEPTTEVAPTDADDAFAPEARRPSAYCWNLAA